MIISVVTSGTETRCLSQNDHRKLRVFERNIIRRIYGVTKVNYHWKIKSKVGDWEFVRQKNIKNFTKANRLIWAGQVARVEGDRLQRRRMNVKYSCKREKKGDPEANGRSWEHTTGPQDRRKWRIIIHEAREGIQTCSITK